MSSFEPDERAGEVDSCEEVSCGFFVACCNAPEVFDGVEETLDEIALGIERVVAVARGLAICLGRDDNLDGPQFQAFDEVIGIVAPVAEHGSGFDTGGKGFGLGDVVGLSACETDGQRISQRIDDDMYFGCQPAARTAYGLVAPPFLRAPALC